MSMVTPWTITKRLPAVIECQCKEFVKLHLHIILCDGIRHNLEVKFETANYIMLRLYM